MSAFINQLSLGWIAVAAMSAVLAPAFGQDGSAPNTLTAAEQKAGRLAEARAWYEKAKELGSTEAAQRITQLPAPAPAPATRASPK